MGSLLSVLLVLEPLVKTLYHLDDLSRAWWGEVRMFKLGNSHPWRNSLTYMLICFIHQIGSFPILRLGDRNVSFGLVLKTSLVGPYQSWTCHWGSRGGKNLRFKYLQKIISTKITVWTFVKRVGFQCFYKIKKKVPFTDFTNNKSILELSSLNFLNFFLGGLHN